MIREIDILSEGMTPEVRALLVRNRERLEFVKLFKEVLPTIAPWVAEELAVPLRPLDEPSDALA